MHLYRKWIVVPALCALLSGCLHTQLGAGTTLTTITVTPLREPDRVIQQLQTPSLANTSALLEPDAWAETADLVKLLLTGTISLDKKLYQQDELYLVTAAGGFDFDINGDQQIDTVASVVRGQWHAVLTGEQLRRGVVTTMTEALYRSLELQLESLSDAEVIAALDADAARVVPDLDGSGSVDYDDVLRWTRSFNPDQYLGPLQRVDELAQALRGAAAADTLRELSQAVLGTLPPAGARFNISGSITVTDSTRVDSDVNDPLADYRVNNDLEQAQEVVNPLVLGGYLNRAGAGETGTSFELGDMDDFYRVNLLEGQRISLVIADDPDLNDIDLYLYDDQGELIDASLGLSEYEQLVVPSDGTYNVGVSIFTGASNYLLTLGIGDLANAAEQLRLSDDFVAGELIARFRQGDQRVNSMPKRRHFTGMRVRGGLGRANLLMLPPQARSADHETRQKLRTLMALKRLRRQQEITSADLNYRVQAAAVPNDAYYRQQSWHYDMINLPAAWENSLGDDVIVAVIDTGMILSHPDLQGQQVSGYDFISSTNTSADGDGIDDTPDDPGDTNGNTRSSFHGTHVAGTIAAASNNTRGVSGVAWNSKVMPLRVLGEGSSGTTYDVLQAVRFAAGLDNDSGTLPPRPASIINLSLSGGGFSSTAQNLYSAVAERGIIVIAAAGNDSNSEFAYPASYDDVISVSAVNINKQRASYSNFGSRIDVAAPGGDGRTRDVNGDGVADLILSTSGDDSSLPIKPTYEMLQGTSMAAPHVAGVAALMKSAYPQLDAAQFFSLLQQGLLTDDLGDPGFDTTYGHGLINANRAVLAAANLAAGGELGEFPSVSASTLALNFGTFTSELQLSLNNGGTGELIIDSVSVADSWLAIEPLNVGAGGLGSYRVSANRELLAIGSHSSSVLIESNAGSATVQVILQQPDPSTVLTGDAGLQYVLLLNVDTNEVQAEAMVYSEAGEYQYEFGQVPAGSYQIYAGSDADNDFVICDAGEACGAWPVLDNQPAIIELRHDLENMNFSTTFKTGIISGAASAVSRQGLKRSSYQAGLR